MAAAAAKGWIVVAALSAALSIAIGAFAAHGLDLSTEAGRKAQGWLQTGSQYEIIHALAILAVVVLVRGALLNSRLAVVAQCLFLAGSVLFPRRALCLGLQRPAMARRGGAAVAAVPSSWAGWPSPWPR